MKYKRGDKVRIKPNLILHKEYDDAILAKGMMQYLGQEVTILKKVTRGYIIQEDNQWTWSESMLETISNKIEFDKEDFIKAYQEGCSDVKNTLSILTKGQVEQWVKESSEITLEHCRNKIAVDDDSKYISIFYKGSLAEKQLTLYKDLLAVAYVLNGGNDWIRWNDSTQQKYYFDYDASENMLNYDSYYSYPMEGMGVFFKSEELLQKAEEILGGKDRFKEAFGIKK